MEGIPNGAPDEVGGGSSGTRDVCSGTGVGAGAGAGAKRKRPDPGNIAARGVRLDEDDDRCFLLSLLPIMKSIPDHFKLISRLEILQTINKFASFPALSPWLLPQPPYYPQQQQQFPAPPPPQPQSTSSTTTHQSQSPTSPSESIVSFLSNFSAGEESTMSIF